MAEWREIGLSCANCGKPLEAMWRYDHGYRFTINGNYPLHYRHTDGTTQCVIIKSPSAYDNWIANRELKRAEQEAMEADTREGE